MARQRRSALACLLLVALCVFAAPGIEAKKKRAAIGAVATARAPAPAPARMMATGRALLAGACAELVLALLSDAGH